MNKKQHESVYAKNKLKENVVNDAWTMIFDLIPQKSRVLDVGCSSGNFGAELIKRKNCEVHGIDINTVDLEIASKHLNGVHKLNIETDALPDIGKFDVILMADVIEHLIDPVTALKKLKAVMKESAILVFSVPNMANISNRLELLNGRFEYTTYGLLDETHLHYYDQVEFEKVLHNAGFSIKKYTNTTRDVPRDVTDSILKRIGLSASEEFYKFTEKLDSITFQFIGIAEVSSKRHAKIETKAPKDSTSHFIDDLNERHAQNTKDINAKIQALEARLATTESNYTDLKNTYEGVISSTSWKITKPLRYLGRFIK